MIPALERQMQEGEELKAILGYLVSSRLSWAIEDSLHVHPRGKERRGSLHFQAIPWLFLSFLPTFSGMFPQEGREFREKCLPHLEGISRHGTSAVTPVPPCSPSVSSPSFSLTSLFCALALTLYPPEWLVSQWLHLTDTL